MNAESTRSLATILLLAMLSATTPTKGQLALEHVYSGGSYSNLPGFQFHNQLFLLELETNGWKYVRIDRSARNVVFYNLNHTLWKTVSFAMTTVLNPALISQDILYISEHLFDLDDGIEFMYCTTYSNGLTPPVGVTQIVDEETAGLIFDVSSQIPVVRPNYHMQQYPILTTPAGTKLVLSNMVNDSAYVYSVPGELSSGMAESWGEHLGSLDVMGLFPNPSNGELSIVLPAPRANALIEIISDNGQVVKTINISGTTGKLDIHTLAVGHYICRVRDDSERPCIGSFIKN